MPWVIAPPSTGPTTTARAVTAPKIPIAQPRRCGGTAAFSSASASGMTIAAPDALHRARRDQRADPGGERARRRGRGEQPSPAAKTRRRPNRSPMAAAVISSTAKVSV